MNKVVYISTKDFHAGYAATRWRNLLSNLPKLTTPPDLLAA